MAIGMLQQLGDVHLLLRAGGAGRSRSLKLLCGGDLNTLPVELIQDFSPTAAIGLPDSCWDSAAEAVFPLSQQVGKVAARGLGNQISTGPGNTVPLAAVLDQPRDQRALAVARHAIEDQHPRRSFIPQMIEGLDLLDAVGEVR